MATVTANISATTQLIGVTEPGTPALKSLHRINAEVIEYLGNLGDDTAVWKVNRGAHGTAAATHSATDDVFPVVPFFPTSVPEVPSDVDAQDITTDLITLGLITQAGA